MTVWRPAQSDQVHRGPRHCMPVGYAGCAPIAARGNTPVCGSGRVHVRQGRVDLHQAGTTADAPIGILAAADAAHPDNGKLPA